MNRSEFWASIATACAEAPDDVEERAEIVRDGLAQQEPAEIIDFDRILHELMAQSYLSSLWGAAYIINGGCSDDGFDYFRGWLIAQGEQVFTEALRDPDSLASVLLDTHDYDAECETLLSVAQEAYEERTGIDLPSAEVPIPDLTIDWTEDDLSARYPALSARFSE